MEQMHSRDILEKIDEIIMNTFELPKSKSDLVKNPASRMGADFKADSLDACEFIFHLEEELDVSVPDGIANKIITREDANIEIIKRKMGKEGILLQLHYTLAQDHPYANTKMLLTEDHHLWHAFGIDLSDMRFLNRIDRDFGIKLLDKKTIERLKISRLETRRDLERLLIGKFGEFDRQM